MSNNQATRDAYGKALLALGRVNPQIVVLDADLSSSTRTNWFAKEFPDRFFNAGVAEQNMVGMAAGLSLSGKIVFASSFAMFCTGRPWEIIRNSLAYPRLNVKLVATHAGLTVGEDGASHQALEDLAIMRVIPHMTVVVPADVIETTAVINEAAKAHGPWYIRLSRAATPVVYNEEINFNLYTAPVLRKGEDITLAACGIMVSQALEAASQLASIGISAEVLNIHTIKPFPKESVQTSLRKTKAVVTIEEHNIIGGMGSALLENITELKDISIEMVGTKDTFGESGLPEALLEKYGLTVDAIVRTAKKALQNKPR